MSDSAQEQVELPIDGILDLHYFRPKDVRELVPDYLEACLEKEIYSVRIIHGKGKGVLRRLVHAILEKHPDVLTYRMADDRSSWGATLAELKKPE
jgi:DNA-nicking Smr family endonuclease